MMDYEVIMLVPIIIVTLVFLVVICCIFWAYYRATRELNKLRDSCLRNHVIFREDTEAANSRTDPQPSDVQVTVEDEVDHITIINELTKPPSYEEPPSYEFALILAAANKENETVSTSE